MELEKARERRIDGAGRTEGGGGGGQPVSRYFLAAHVLSPPP